MFSRRLSVKNLFYWKWKVQKFVCSISYFSFQWEYSRHHIKASRGNILSNFLVEMHTVHWCFLPVFFNVDSHRFCWRMTHLLIFRGRQNLSEFFLSKKALQCMVLVSYAYLSFEWMLIQKLNRKYRFWSPVTNNYGCSFKA